MEIGRKLSRSPNQACIVVPLHRFPLTRDEEISLSALRENMELVPIYFVVPNGLPIPANFLHHEKIVRFPKKYFTYPFGYNALLLSSKFYSSFGLYEFMLIYQLDCLVFRNEISKWCDMGYDYIGSPWWDSYGAEDTGVENWKVGNGGFSLRKISTAKAILKRKINRGSLYPVPPPSRKEPGFWSWLLLNSINRFKQHMSLWTVEDELNNYCENEDRWWAVDVMRIVPEYKKPNVSEAMMFGFETDPKHCLEMTGGKLPFGCHAWWKHDREFWETALRETKQSRLNAESCSQ